MRKILIDPAGNYVPNGPEANRIAAALRKRIPIPEKDIKLIAESPGRILRRRKAGPRAIAAAGRLGVAIIAINQADDHLEAKWGRIDAGQATEAQDVRVSGVKFEVPSMPGDAPALQVEQK